jgi:predicted transcriptional regulator
MGLQVQEIGCKTGISRANRGTWLRVIRATTGHFHSCAPAKVVMSETVPQPPLLHLTAQIVAAYTSHNRITFEALLRLIRTVYGAVAGTGQAVVVEAKPQPAVPVKRSVFPDHLVCLEDGKKLKMLKRHLMTTYKLTPEQYRQRWDLPADYPMVARDYAARRSALAKKIGLGRNLASKAVATPETRSRQARSTTPAAAR